MPNSKLREEFEKGPAHFLRNYALTNPGSTNPVLARKDEKDVYVNEYLEYGGTFAELSRAKPQSFQAKAKVVQGAFDYLSMVGGDASSGRVVGSVDDLNSPEGGRIQLVGTPQVALTVRTDQPDGLPLYFLPWKGDNAITFTLGQDARFFVTAAMTGCTFQVTGTPEAPVVSHANAGGKLAGEKLGSMDALLKKAIEDKLQKGRTPGGKYTTTRLQTGLWGLSQEKGLKEVNYAASEAAYKAKFDSKVAGLMRDTNSYSTGEIEVEETLDGGHKQIVVSVVGWRPPAQKGWEFYYQVWADFNVTRKVYRKEKGIFGTKRKTLEKTKVSDFVLLVPGTRFWPGGRGWPDTSSGKLRA